MEYTLTTSASVILVLILDYILKTYVIRRKMFWILHLFILVMEFMTNGYLTWRPIVIYGEEFQLGLRVFTIPIEDFFYGFSLITLNIVLFEYFLKRSKGKKV